MACSYPKAMTQVCLHFCPFLARAALVGTCNVDKMQQHLGHTNMFFLIVMHSK